MYVTARLVYLAFQETNLIAFYLYNIYQFTDDTLIILTIISDVIIALVGVLLLTYYTDIFYIGFFMFLNLGLILGNYTNGVSSKELITYISMSAFSLLSIIYSIIKYGSLIWGDKSIDTFEESLGHTLNKGVYKLSLTTL
jgi:hypothetical protein